MTPTRVPKISCPIIYKYFILPEIEIISTMGRGGNFSLLILFYSFSTKERSLCPAMWIFLTFLIIALRRTFRRPNWKS